MCISWMCCSITAPISLQQMTNSLRCVHEMEHDHEHRHRNAQRHPHRQPYPHRRPFLERINLQQPRYIAGIWFKELVAVVLVPLHPRRRCLINPDHHLHLPVALYILLINAFFFVGSMHACRTSSAVTMKLKSLQPLLSQADLSPWGG